MDKGLIVSIQGYSKDTTQELATKCIEAKAIAIRTDIEINVDVPVIYLKKHEVLNRKDQAYITSMIEDIKEIELYMKEKDFIAIDYRIVNNN